MIPVKNNLLILKSYCSLIYNEEPFIMTVIINDKNKYLYMQKYK